MNIWFFNHHASGPGASGGTRTYDLAKELVKQGYQVTIFASSFVHQSDVDTRFQDSNELVKEEYLDGVRFIWVKTKVYTKNDWRRIKNMLDYTVRAYRYAKKLQENPDIIIGSLMHPFAPVIAYKLAKKKKAIFLFEERDLWPQTLIDVGNVSKYNPVVIGLSLLEKFLYKKANKIILLFDKAVHYVESRGIDTAKVLYLPNGVDLSRFDSYEKKLPSEMEQIFQQLQLENKFIAIYTGSHGITDYLDSLLLSAQAANEKRKDIHFVFVGNGPEKERLLQMKQNLGLTNVTFLPSVPKEFIPYLLEQADVGLVSLNDAELYKWGISFNKIYDYMAASLPILLLSQREESHIQNSGCGMIVNNPEEMADSLIALSQDEDKRLEFGRKGRKYVEAYHSWENLSKKLVSVLNEELQIEEGGFHMSIPFERGENVIIQDDVQLGEGVTIGNNVIIYEGTIIGDNVVIQDNAVIGKRPTKAKYSILKDKEKLSPTTIGNGVVIGTSAIVYANATIKDSVYIADLATIRERVFVGNGTIVGRGVSIENDCTVGDRCKLETNCYITAHSILYNEVFIAPCVVTSNDAFMGRTEDRFHHIKGVTVMNGGRIGANAIILPGIVIEEEGVVAAGSVVTKDVGKCDLVMGIPAKKVKDVPDNQLRTNK
ncbi:acetyltransferase-like isoleucine patch superfamily enzyme [Salirhabdus euzebyi]|uniref:Acetyltransferase-like isoleucine patch superfamily enzyme n=1 Tax=Salirhabdus euzebyi TaxID=394506 RepID=A0A841Q4I6_9BACI|nr:glycosyltransferase [Salirhabdus euzebyi]MBB6453305.1 acetyltransferase-like isoleucine patch superfamily enzyme [Salirhabdus euzebyi]